MHKQHTNPAKRHAGIASRRVIPTALAVAGSVSSADHSSTFPDLVAHLRSEVSRVFANPGWSFQLNPKCSLKGCYAALLHPQDLQEASGVAAALASLLRQFSSLDTPADDLQVCYLH